MFSRKRVRYAIVGLGYISQAATLPAFTNAKENSELTALVSDDADKLKELGDKYDVRHRYSYDQYEDCLRSGEVDAVYIGLPNTMHRDYTIQAARAGIHVLCEKPMAMSDHDCEAMIEAAEENHVKLMIAYRLHFEEANLKAVEEVRAGRLGDARLFDSVFTQQVEGGNIRLRKETGGGTLYDIGIYCINAARYIFRAEPTEVFCATASKGDPRFHDVEEMASAILRFPEERLAAFTCSFGGVKASTYRVVGTKGTLWLDPAYEFADDLKHYWEIEGKSGSKTFAKRDQFGPQLVYFSNCIIGDESPEPSGWEGLADVRIIRALYRSAETHAPVSLPPFERRRRPTMEQEEKKPAVKKPELVHARPPSGKQ